MLHYEFIDPPGLHYARFWEPFRFDEIWEHAATLASSGSLGRPTMLDLRAVSLVQVPEEKFRRLIMRRKNAGEEAENNLVATVVGSKIDFAKIRMYGVFADLSGLREETNSFVTESIDDAVEWLHERMESADVDAFNFQIGEAEMRAARMRG